MTDDEAFMLQQALARLDRVEHTLGMWRQNGADSFFQESGFRFGTRVDVGDLGVQIVPQVNETIGVAFLPDFVAGQSSMVDMWTDNANVSGVYGSASEEGEVSVAVHAASTGLSEAELIAGTSTRTATLTMVANDADAAAYADFDATPVKLGNFTADPTYLEDGMIWYRSDLDTFRVRANGATFTLDMTAV